MCLCCLHLVLFHVGVVVLLFLVFLSVVAPPTQTLNAPNLIHPSLEEDRDAFFNKLYVHVMRSMHVALNSLRERKMMRQDEVPEGYDSDLEARFLRWAQESERDVCSSLSFVRLMFSRGCGSLPWPPSPCVHRG